MMNWRIVIAEFVGTTAIVFIAVGAIVSDQVTNGAVGLTGIALAYGFATAAMVSATHGGHLNPAISFGLLVSGNTKFTEFLARVVAQCTGAFAASSLLMSTAPELELRNVNYGIPQIGDEITVGMALAAEVVLTFILVLSYHGAGLDRSGKRGYGGFVVGLAVAAGVLMGGPISGAAMNPARWLGPAVIGSDITNAWVFVVGPLAGGSFASWLHPMLVTEKHTSD
jgi:aquaporin Z